jgi:tetratricopeptide (TPR) repeat protein
MEMKTNSVILVVFIIAVFFFSSCKTVSSSKEMPITTSSKEALKAFKEGRVNFEYGQTNKAADLFKKALKLDPEFALANLYLSFSDGSFYPEKFEKAISLKDKVSKGEQAFLEMFDNQRKGNGAELEKNCQTLSELYPEDARTQFFLGSYIYSGDDEKALFYFKKQLNWIKILHQRI